ncbi:ABC transporter ATP-binding protein [Halarchaeum grantii]|uniref:ABC-type D-xylose/L-arabinose transporter n=1 Tax=Halarchaeum grantii TaxID=1193105 RepID=A0A830EZ92_9EURY|nr:sn-glycerol-3-phosphate ABC transporter ATP-binding protein UgpC [Halarchaeum grantii]GGL44803.1 ABC transporter ATP-binding protein [Halarchaeum grantii]
MARIELDDIRKTFQDAGSEIVATDDVSLDIEDGEFLVLVGPSGSGKSTLLRMIAGLERQTDGDIHIGDTLVNDLEPRERDIAMVFQNYALYPNMTVRENMSFGLKMSTDLSKDEIDERVESAAETMGIHLLLDSTPEQMSGGEKQRAALGRAIVRDPNVFLMDEPLSNLDAKLRSVMRTEIKRLQRELGVTTVYVTHDQTEAMTMSDRLAILDGGNLQQLGTPLECFYRPANTFVAGFIGDPSMNFFDVTHEDGRLVAQDLDYDLSEDAAASATGHDELVFGVRPEDIDLREDRGENDFEVEVDVVEPMGSLKYAYVKRPGSDDEETYIVEVNGQRPIDVGDTLYAHVPHGEFHLFDRRSREAVHHRDLRENTEEELLEKMNDTQAATS